jgi:hypothetical protein
MLKITFVSVNIRRFQNFKDKTVNSAHSKNGYSFRGYWETSCMVMVNTPLRKLKPGGTNFAYTNACFLSHLAETIRLPPPAIWYDITPRELKTVSLRRLRHLILQDFMFYHIIITVIKDENYCHNYHCHDYYRNPKTIISIAHLNIIKIMFFPLRPICTQP